MARCHRSVISRVGNAATLMLFSRKDKEVFNFPTERMAPMSQEAVENESKGDVSFGFLKTGEVFKADLEIPQTIIHRAVCDGIGWSMGSYPKKIIEITGPYADYVSVKCESEFDLLDLKRVLVETVHNIPQHLFENILMHGLKTIMGNVSNVSVKRIWTHSQAIEMTITFQANDLELKGA